LGIGIGITENLISVSGIGMKRNPDIGISIGIGMEFQ